MSDQLVPEEIRSASCFMSMVYTVPSAATIPFFIRASQTAFLVYSTMGVLKMISLLTGLPTACL